MFLPLKTEAHDGKVRFGALAIIAISLFIHLLVWRDNVSRSGEVGGLEQELTRHTAEKKLEDMLKGVGGDGNSSCFTWPAGSSPRWVSCWSAGPNPAASPWSGLPAPSRA